MFPTQEHLWGHTTTLAQAVRTGTVSEKRDWLKPLQQHLPELIFQKI